ncbi:unnamed protein product [Caenorhabditis bovis]|uniref:Domain of unknown function DB domain-containing protein n=1 Tax=Caenorhabditis bovis TaxID=2654633 RepID=A0A8S1EXA9_9PELO|nr:unnamed protein product [Caenorhabditis bovis]
MNNDATTDGDWICGDGASPTSRIWTKKLGQTMNCWFTWITVLCTIRYGLSLDALRRVDGSHYARRRHVQMRRVTSGFHRDAPTPFFDNVIHSPLENKRIYTKDNFYINAIHPKSKEAQLYESMLVDGKGSVNDIDAFFVTPPPSRTTLAPRREGWNDLPKDMNLIKVSQGSVKDEEEVIPTKPPLKLVTLPPLMQATLPPFKHNNPVQFSQSQWQLEPIAPPVRFPAQPWQIPPPNGPTTPNPLAQWFVPTPAPSIPPNPFFTPPNNSPVFGESFSQSKNLTQPTPPQKQESYDPYIPIGIGNANFVPQGTQNVRPIDLQHRRNMRIGGFAKNNAVQTPIALPVAGQIDTPLNIAKEKEFGNFGTPSQFQKKLPPPIDYSVDSVAVVQKKPDEIAIPYRENAKNYYGRSAVPEKSSEQLRKFVKVHPHVAGNIQPPMIYRGKELVIPKMFNFTNQVAPPLPPQPMAPQQIVPQPLSYFPTMNPNQKLDLCCRKQRVSPICQNLCNFDTFNDKSLVSAFLTNQCPGPQLGQAYDCASSKADHSMCCERAGLLSFQAGKCMPFCRTHVATPANVFDYFVCLQVFEAVKGCYREYQFTHPNIFGD